MKTATGLIVSALALGFSSQVMAQAAVEIEWDKPEKFRDVRPSNENRKKFKNATFRHIDEYMKKLAEDLPKSKKLLMTVSDLDLAGEVMPASFAGLGHSASEVRVIKSIDIPRITFSYQLLGESGEVEKQAEVKLKDMSFLDSSNRHFQNDRLRYEKNMLSRWFKKEFQDYFVEEEAKS